PHTTMCWMPSALGNADGAIAPATSCACVSCSGRPSTASRKRMESLVTRASLLRLRLERRLDAVRLRLGHQPLVLGVVDGGRLVDEHDRDVVLHVVTPLEPRVVERRFVREVEERPLVLGAREDLEQFRIKGHRPCFY